MTRAEKLNELLTEVLFMRKNQKNYFACTPGTTEKLQALKDSKRSEARVDNLIQELTTNQIGLEL